GGVRAEVEHLVPLGLEERAELLLQREAGVVRGDRDPQRAYPAPAGARPATSRSHQASSSQATARYVSSGSPNGSEMSSSIGFPSNPSRRRPSASFTRAGRFGAPSGRSSSRRTSSLSVKVRSA